MLMPWRKNDRGPEPQPGDLDGPWVAVQAACYLSGTYRELLTRAGRPVPAWAWVNALAHGSLDDLARLASDHPGPEPPAALVSRLAKHVLLRLRNEDVSLVDLQAQLLIPLELSLAAELGEGGTFECAALSKAVARAFSEGLEPLSRADRRQR